MATGEPHHWEARSKSEKAILDMSQEKRRRSQSGLPSLHHLETLFEMFFKGLAVEHQGQKTLSAKH